MLKNKFKSYFDHHLNVTRYYSEGRASTAGGQESPGVSSTECHPCIRRDEGVIRHY